MKNLFSFLLLFFMVANNVNAVTLEQRAEQYRKHTVKLQSTSGQDVCTGVIISQNVNKTIVLTAKHCIFYGVMVEYKKPELIVEYQNHDLAIVYLDGRLLNKVPVEFSKTNARKYDPVFSFGYPRGNEEYYGGVVTEEFFSAYIKKYDNIVAINYLTKISIGLNPGNSGGGIYNKNNELVGIGIISYHSGIYSGMVPISQVYQFLEAMSKL